MLDLELTNILAIERRIMKSSKSELYEKSPCKKLEISIVLRMYAKLTQRIPDSIKCSHCYTYFEGGISIRSDFILKSRRVNVLLNGVN